VSDQQESGPGIDGPLAAALDGLADLAPDAVPCWVDAAAASMGFAAASVYLVDLQETVLLPWPASKGSPERVDGTLAGRAFQRGASLRASDGTWWFPLTDGGDRLGVLQLAVASALGGGSVAVAGGRLAGITAVLIASRRRQTDRIELTSRTRELSLAAELRWSLLPPRTLTAPHVTVSGHLEPAYEIAGDSYDYALNGDTLDLGVFDAMGHGLRASRLANLAVISYRHARRSGADPAAMYRHMDAALLSEFGDGSFVTGHLARLDITTGALQVANAGHPHPLLIRAGAAHPLHFEPATPIGLGYVSAETGLVQLEPGDAVLIYSDGVTEARSAGGDLFGLDRVGDLAARALADQESIPETVRRLVTSLLTHRGVDLEDDATFVMFRWRP
jgi:serine phosphatase RsbU (regulator of sigma subunit)